MGTKKYRERKIKGKRESKVREKRVKGKKSRRKETTSIRKK